MSFESLVVLFFMGFLTGIFLYFVIKEAKKFISENANFFKKK